ncbi:MAG: hypothetical protein KF718_14240 [Polyangiaceae bacterium]|nr:hypothetical protein [Polyangiaceae bacterium]
MKQWLGEDPGLPTQELLRRAKESGYTGKKTAQLEAWHAEVNTQTPSRAAGCQQKIAEKIVEKGADYLLALMSNQPLLHRPTRNAPRSSLIPHPSSLIPHPSSLFPLPAAPCP